MRDKKRFGETYEEALRMVFSDRNMIYSRGQEITEGDIERLREAFIGDYCNNTAELRINVLAIEEDLDVMVVWFGKHTYEVFAKSKQVRVPNLHVVSAMDDPTRVKLLHRWNRQ